MKRGTIIPILGILLIGLVSAFNLNYGGYFDDTSIALGALFVLFFAAINFILGRTAFGRNAATRTIMALAISLIAVYGISNTNFSVSGAYFGHWYIGDYLPTLLTVIFVAGMAFLLYKFRLARVLIGAGLILIILSQTNLIYEKASVLVVGIVLTIIGIFLLLRYKRTPRERKPREPIEPRLKINDLIKEAKYFKKVAIRLARRKRKSPKFYLSWAHFVGYLKRKRYGKNEKEILQYFNATSSDMKRIVRRYIL